MPKPLNLKLRDYCKAVEICIEEKYGHLKHYDNGGAEHTFLVFEKKDDDKPAVIWSVHFGHNKKKEIWSREDFKKIYDKTAVAKERFLEILKKITKKNFNV
ncbi:MAG: hypothetical protein WD896_02450 [Parcubacteria group bacterium]